MELFKKCFLSMGATLFFLLLFACFSGLATIIESYYNTETAWALVYGAAYFAAIQLILGINLLYNICKFRMYKKRSFPAFVFHASFLFILLGSALTRYWGFEGTLHIRQDAASNQIQSRNIYISLSTKDQNKTIEDKISKYISASGNSDFNLAVDVDGKKAELKYKNFVPNAISSWVESKIGKPVAIITFSGGEESINKTMVFGDGIESGPVSFVFGKEPQKSEYVKILIKSGEFYINTNVDITYIDMSDISSSKPVSKAVPKGEDFKFQTMRLYDLDGLKFSPRTLLASAVQQPTTVEGKMEQGDDALVATLSYNGQSKDVSIFKNHFPQNISVGGREFKLGWSPEIVSLPFSLYLKKFLLQRYPGSQSPASYSSDVVVRDGDTNLEYNIYMNHVLDYKGYRFFQSSYDTDEKGTILSVNKDPGKLPTYIGYFLLGLGFFINIINPNSRFSKLASLLKETNKKAAISLLFVASFISTQANSASLPHIDKSHAQKLSMLVIQGFDGRMKPFDTVSREVLSKIYGKDYYQDMDSNQMALSMMINADFWRLQPIVKVSDEELKDLLKIPQTARYAAFDNFYTMDDNITKYKLMKFSEMANRKTPSTRTLFDKDVIKVDERLNILYMVFTGDIFRMVPKQNDPNNTWYSPLNSMMYFPDAESKEVSKVMQGYLLSAISAQQTGNWADADAHLEALKSYQQKHGASVLPSDSRVEFEIMFNKLQIFKQMMPIYLIAGFVLVLVVFARLIVPNLRLKAIFNIIYSVNILAFIALTIGLGIRWYISEHAPWSNTYESLIFIAWALALSGIVFSRSSAISLALTSVMAGVTLFVAHLNAIDPQITNLMPVLNSYWLTIHVSVITSSYGFFGLCSILGGFTLVLLLLQRKKENPIITANILEATRINEMAMILGLSLLTLGNFLGGVWANESWGRYWGWDSKETWALVSILVYAAIIHFRFVPKLNNQFAFAVASMFAFSSILMTYFGVNFYLTGMHSYAQGDPVPVPWYVYLGGASMFILSIAASFKIKFARKL